MDKRLLRKHFLALRDQLSSLERERGDILVTEKILGHQWYYGAEYVLLFASYGSEISTRMILEDALKAGKKVYCPKVKDHQMDFYQIFSLLDLQKGFRQIPEPVGTQAYVPLPQLAHKTLMIMPGLAFDSMGNRLGYGGGYYDRYLQDKEWLRTIAIGYRCQMAKQLPFGEWDIKPAQIICF